jgi:hypothetical protein
MKTPYFRLALVGAVILITQAAPDLPATALAQRIPIEPIPFKPVPVRPVPRGGGCGGAPVPVAKVPVRPPTPIEVPKISAPPAIRIEPLSISVRPAMPEVRPTIPGVPAPELSLRPAPVGGAIRAPERVGALEDIRVSGVKRDWARVDELAGKELGRPGHAPAVTDDLKAVQTAARTSLAVERVLPAVDAKATPDAPDLEQRLADLLAATGDKDLVRDVKEFRGVEALRRGNAEEAKKLPEGWEKEDPRALLRDMKKRFEARYPAAPDEKAAPPKVGPVPHLEGKGVKAAPKEKPGEGLPPLDEEADTAERVCRERLTAALRIHADRPLPSLYLSLDRLRQRAHDGESAEKHEAACEEEVAKLLGRELEPSERVLVGVMRRQGKSPKEMADVLSRLPAESPKR